MCLKLFSSAEEVQGHYINILFLVSTSRMEKKTTYG